MSKIKNGIPNMFTLGNLACGIISLIMTYEENYRLAAMFIILAALLDRYDGRIARFLEVSNDIGKELDSLADLISFGVAPSILVFNLNNFISLGIIGYLFLLVFPLSGAYRLARYNIRDFTGVFSGIPITIAGIILVIYSMFTMDKNININLTLFLMAFLSYLMLSNFKIKKI